MPHRRPFDLTSALVKVTGRLVATHIRLRANRSPGTATDLRQVNGRTLVFISHRLAMEVRDGSGITSLCLLAVLKVLCRGDAGPDTGAARREARATSRLPALRLKRLSVNNIGVDWHGCCHDAAIFLFS